ncbi:bifunctional precorrin-2 dehydrogenase/sirohydrochlorin ferrochelatase [Geotalea sp. SG265]|uniref:precorrin-2 dehydrogenase/sirohydrochlorin ferrochelatase family protein n=1 Tax=Geotalea sp. SG265 TaxID=2922867 RepID=UPI001FAF0286|nr:bifunctional precorrin-2 dehydrogenase/sirohydrochlorin ferrochelatase [Geotalea sp. SG265]
MSFFPLNINLTGRAVVIIGGGAVAARKVAALLDTGARITIVAPQLSEELATLRDSGAVEHLPRLYERGDLRGAFFAIAATNDSSVNWIIAGEAHRQGILVDVCDAPELSSFTMPAVMRRGDLVIAISTGGKSPALAKKIRLQLEGAFGPEYELTLKLLGALREKLLTAQGNSAYNKALLSQLAAQDLPRLIRERRYDRLDQLLHQHFGSEFSISRLLKEEKDHR